MTGAKMHLSWVDWSVTARMFRFAADGLANDLSAGRLLPVHKELRTG